jgi:hypothetical protein
MKPNSSIRIRSIIFLAVTIFLLSVSCKKSGNLDYPVSYVVANSTDSEIKVIFNGLLNSWGGGGGYCDVEDSIVYLEPGVEKTLFIATWAHMGNPETDSTIRGMKILRVYMNETVQSTSDFMEAKYWAYKELIKTRGELRLVVRTSDFGQ